MSEPKPQADVEEEVPAAKSAEDRKAASALASLDATADDTANNNVDQDAASKAMKNLGGGASGGGSSSATTATAAAAAPKKNVKVDAADVTLLVDELEMTKPRATEMLKAHDGDAVKALRAYVAA